MIRSLKVGRIWGIDINIHPSFGLVPLWVIWQWGVSESHGVIAFILGLLLVTLVFGSVLLHELGHCAMAQELGISVLDITLWPFGGVARIEQTPSQPRSEFLIALAGPLTNLAIAVALVPLILAIGVIQGRDALFATENPLGTVSFATLLTYLVTTNIFIAVFNLLPAFPVDGGRLLRSVLSRRMGRSQATRIAVIAGIGFAVVLVVFGLVQRHVLPIVLAGFLVMAAQSEARVERIQSAMRRLRVGQFALWDMGGVSPNQSLMLAMRGGPRDIAVTDGGRVVGMLWRNQLMEGLSGGYQARLVREVMDTPVEVVDVNDSIDDVQRLMHRTHRWAVPVTEGGRYRGIFTADRFASLYGQISPGLPGSSSISEEWREAIVHTFSAWKHSRRR